MNLSVNAEMSVYRKKNTKRNPNPVVSHSWKSVYQDCPEHEDCFDYSIEQNWHFWSCAECPRYKEASPSPPKVLHKSPKPTVKPKPTPSPQPKRGLWNRVTSMLNGKKSKKLR